MQRRSIVRAIGGTIVFLLMCLSVRAADFPESQAGKVARGWVNVFNSGDRAAMEVFLLEHLSPAAGERMSVPQRLEAIAGMQADFQKLTLHTLLRSTDIELQGLFESSVGEWLELTFRCEPQPPHQFVGMQLQTIEPPDEAAPGPALSRQEFEREAIAYLDSLSVADLFSGVVLIAIDSSPLLTYTSGLARVDQRVPNRPDTRFNLGSINKVFTQVAIAQLAEQGKLRFGDTLGQYLPGYPNESARQKVTIGHLLTMRSGIGDFFGEQFDVTPKTRFRSLADYLPMFADQPLHFEPGSQDEYSNGGYVVLGLIIEKLTGQSYYDYVRDRIFVPSGMIATDSWETDKLPAECAFGYTTATEAVTSSATPRISNTHLLPAKGSSAGGGYSTASDLLRFALALKENRLLSARGTDWVVNRSYSDKPDGGISRPLAGLGIAGGTEGVNALLDSDFGSGITIIVLSNLDPPTAERTGRRLHALLGRLELD